jgi:RimJ/RimL family protein N-acetyltransferase
MNTILNLEEDHTLEDERALLRPLKQDDFQNLLHISLNEPDICKYSLLNAAGEENLKNYINIALREKESGKEYPFIVFDKKANKYAGSTRFYDINLPFKTLQLGYTWYAKEFRGTGLNKHCKFLLLSFAFEKLDMERVEFRADNKNERSIAAMKSIGCTVEGVLRNHQPTRDAGIRRDSIVLSILKDEWFSGIKENLAQQIRRIK